MTQDRLPEPRIETGPATVHKIVISKAGHIYAHVFLYEMPIWKNGTSTHKRDGNIQQTWVHPDFREQGYAKIVMEKAIALARTLCMRRISLTSRDIEERQAARHIYKELGFEITTDGFTLELREKEEKAE